MRLDMAPVLITTVVLLSAFGCTKSTPSEPPAATQPPPAPAAAPKLGLVSGAAAPNAIVVLEPSTPREFPEGGLSVMDQVALTFTPEMMFVRTGERVEFRNSDDTLHNVHVGNVDTREPSFNVAIPSGEKYGYTFAKDGFYHVSCDIHPAMSAEILSVSTPFVMMAGADGRFSFADVPPGAYRLRTHAAGARQERDVEVRAGENVVPASPGEGSR